MDFFKQASDKCFHYTVKPVQPEDSRLDPDVKYRCLKVISCVGVSLATAAKVDGSDLSSSELVAAAMRSVFNTMRQEANATGGRLPNKTKGSSYRLNAVNDANFTYSDIEVLWNFFLSVWRMSWKKTPTAEEGWPIEKWMGTMVPYLAFVCSYKHRKAEIRTGHYTFVTGKKDGKAEGIPVSRFGLDEPHHIYLEGCTFPPDLQSNTAQSIGPLTTAIRVTMEKRSDIYNAKLRAALDRSYQAYPWAKFLFNALLNSTPEVSAPLISALGNISLLNPPKYQRRCYPPLFYVMIYCLTSTEIEGASTTFDKQGKAKPPTGNMGDRKDRSLNPYWIDFSGKGCMRMWEECNNSQWKCRGYGGTPSDWTDLHYHSVWGTHTEDFGLLKWQTNREFKTRREMGNFARKPNDTAVKLLFNIEAVNHRFYSKMVSGNVTGITSGRRKQLTANPVRAGKRKLEYTQEVIDALEESRETKNLGVDISSLTHRITEDFKSLLDKKQVGVSENWGNVKWSSCSKSDLGHFVVGAETEEVAPCSGKFFI